MKGGLVKQAGSTGPLFVCFDATSPGEMISGEAFMRTEKGLPQ